MRRKLFTLAAGVSAVVCSFGRSALVLCIATSFAYLASGCRGRGQQRAAATPADSRSRTAEAPPPPPRPDLGLATKPAVPLATAPAVPVLDFDRQHQLPPARLDSLLKMAEGLPPAADDGRRVWFVGAFKNDPVYFHQIVYFAPDSASPRLRRGRCAIFWWWTGGRPAVEEYVQVSRRDAPFTDDLKVPPARDLPFPPQDGRSGKKNVMSDDDLIDLIDTARPIVDPATAYDSDPYIYGIARFDGGEFTLATGDMEGGLSFPFKRRAGGGFRPDGDGMRWSGSPY